MVMDQERLFFLKGSVPFIRHACRTASSSGGSSSCGLSLGCEKGDGMNLGSTDLRTVLPQ